MMQTEALKNHISKGENKIAAALLQRLSETFDNKLYADAYIKILLVETVKSLNESISGFYYSENEVIERLFKDGKESSAESVVNEMCRRVKSAAAANRQTELEKVKSYIHANFTDNQFTVRAAAEYAGITQTELCKLFLKSEGMAPVAYVGKLRVEESLKLLPHFSVGETSARVGFCAEESFIRVFKRHIGETPGSWKRNKLFL